MADEDPKAVRKKRVISKEDQRELFEILMEPYRDELQKVVNAFSSQDNDRTGITRTPGSNPGSSPGRTCGTYWLDNERLQNRRCLKA